MDPITLASTVFVLLSPFITEAGKAFAGRVGDAAFEQAKHLYQVIHSRFAKEADGGKSSKVLESFSADPEEYGTNFQNKLLPLLQNDPDFAKALEQIVKSGPPLGPRQEILARDTAQVLRNRMINTTREGKQVIDAAGGAHVEDNLMSMGPRPSNEEKYQD